MSLQYYCDLCTENILTEDRRERNYIDVAVEIKRLKTRLHICTNCASNFAGMFIGKTKDKLLDDMRDRLKLPKMPKEYRKR